MDEASRARAEPPRLPQGRQEAISDLGSGGAVPVPRQQGRIKVAALLRLFGRFELGLRALALGQGLTSLRPRLVILRLRSRRGLGCRSFGRHSLFSRRGLRLAVPAILIVFADPLAHRDRQPHRAGQAHLRQREIRFGPRDRRRHLLRRRHPGRAPADLDQLAQRAQRPSRPGQVRIDRPVIQSAILGPHLHGTQHEQAPPVILPRSHFRRWNSGLRLPPAGPSYNTPSLTVIARRRSRRSNPEADASDPELLPPAQGRGRNDGIGILKGSRRSSPYSASSRITLIRSDLPSKPMPGRSGMTMWPASTRTPSGKPP
ncbi:hypothetical protein QFZ27_007072 [Inquilinus ginsengisoli]